MTTEVDTLTTEVSTLTAEVTGLTAEVEQLSTQVEHLNALTAEVSALTAEVDQLTAEAAAANKLVEECEAELREQEGVVEGVKSENAELHSRLEVRGGEIVCKGVVIAS